MSEFLDLRDQANDVAETAKDAMKNHGLVADKTTQTLSRTIPEESKRLLPNDRVVQSLTFEVSDLDWSSVRSVMQAEAPSAAASTSNQRTPWLDEINTLAQTGRFRQKHRH
jgi:hypothetical protein